MSGRRLTQALLGLAFAVVPLSAANAAADPVPQDIHLEISPRICTLKGTDKQCQTPVHAQWQAPHDESLCLVVLERPDIKHCWEHFSKGTYTIELTFGEDLMFQLRDVSLE